MPSENDMRTLDFPKAYREKVMTIVCGDYSDRGRTVNLTRAKDTWGWSVNQRGLPGGGDINLTPTRWGVNLGTRKRA